MTTTIQECTKLSTLRVEDLRQRVRSAMGMPLARWECPARIAEDYAHESVQLRKARAITLKLSAMPTDLWRGQLIAGSMTLESPRLHVEWGFPEYVTDSDREGYEGKWLDTGCFGHIVPDYPALLTKGLRGIRDDAQTERQRAESGAEREFLDSVVIALDAVEAFAERLGRECDRVAESQDDQARAAELRTMADNLRVSPSGPPQTFHQALQSVWLLHMIFHCTRNRNALGRVDQYAWPYLEADLRAGRLDMERASELVDCFCLKFNERAKATEDQMPENREDELLELSNRTRHSTSTQIATKRDGIDATNHWLQNIVVGGFTPEGDDGTNPLSLLLLESYGRNEMTNPLLNVRLHSASPEGLLRTACEVLKSGGGMPAIFNDDALVPALIKSGVAIEDARDYTNDGCWEVIMPGRTDFRFQRLSLALCLERALFDGRSLIDGKTFGARTGDAKEFSTFEDLWDAFVTQIDAMVKLTVEQVMATADDRSILAPVPLLSALVDGCIRSRRDMTAGGAKYRTYGMLAESAAHAIDSLAAIETVVFEQKAASMGEVLRAIEDDFEGAEDLRRKLADAPKYGNDDPAADALGRRVIGAFVDATSKHAASHAADVLFPCGVATFSWYVGIGEGLGASADGRRSGTPVSSNFSPALGCDVEGLPATILSYSKMEHPDLPAGGPLDLRVAKRLVLGDEGTDRMVALLRTLVDAGGSIMTLTVADTEELRAAQREPERYKSLRVRMGGWCAYFTMLSHEQQDHHIRRQEARS